MAHGGLQPPPAPICSNTAANKHGERCQRCESHSSSLAPMFTGKCSHTTGSLPPPSSAFWRPRKTHLFHSSLTRAAKERKEAWELKLLRSLITTPDAGLLADFGRDHFCHWCLLSRSTLYGPTCCKSWSSHSRWAGDSCKPKGSARERKKSSESGHWP